MLDKIITEKLIEARDTISDKLQVHMEDDLNKDAVIAATEGVFAALISDVQEVFNKQEKTCSAAVEEGQIPEGRQPSEQKQSSQETQPKASSLYQTIKEIQQEAEEHNDFEIFTLDLSENELTDLLDNEKEEYIKELKQQQKRRAGIKSDRKLSNDLPKSSFECTHPEENQLKESYELGGGRFCLKTECQECYKVLDLEYYYSERTLDKLFDKLKREQEAAPSRESFSYRSIIEDLRRKVFRWINKNQ